MIRRGQRGQQVADLQNLLNSAGIGANLIPDGIFGAMTEAAVRKFQAERGLPIDGVADAMTLEMLRKVTNTPKTDHIGILSNNAGFDMPQRIIFVDAGHGAIDPRDGQYTTQRDLSNGKFFTFTQRDRDFHSGKTFFEGVSNRIIAAQFMEMANKEGYLCVPVYHPFLDTNLIARTDTANRFAKDYQAQKPIFLSFHSNAHVGTSRGFIVMYSPNREYPDLELARIADKHIRPEFERNGSIFRGQTVREGWIQRPNGQKFMAHVLQAPKMPSILVENGFFDNIGDATLLMQDDFRKSIARKTLDAVNEFYLRF